MRKMAFLALLGLAGCAAPSETIYLARGADRVQCGPYKEEPFAVGDQAPILEKRLRDCVSDFQRQGYQRVSGQ